MNVWNDYFSSVDIAFRTESYHMSVTDWHSLRPMLYLDQDTFDKMGVPTDLTTKLLAACDGKKDCSCLDREPTTKSSALKANDFKGAVMKSYGDHVEKLYRCYAGMIEENPALFSPELPERCR